MAFASKNMYHGFPSPGPQNMCGEKVMEHLFFLSESEWKHAKEDKEYDIIIIGSGFCALAVAERALAKDPGCQVLIVERGTLFLQDHFQNLPQPFSRKLSRLSETYPWTLSARTAQGEDGVIRWQHGMIPFFGGRSTMWSGWCHEPTREEMNEWPQKTIQTAQDYFLSANDLLHVRTADKIDADKDSALLEIIAGQRPIYAALQDEIQQLLKKYGSKVSGVYHMEPARLASDSQHTREIDFRMYSVLGELLSLVSKQVSLKNGACLDIATNCIVEKIDQRDGSAIGLETSRGVLPLGNAKLVLAMGTLPPTTLVQNSFPQVTNAGKRFSAHFMSSIIARVPRDNIERRRKFGELEMGAFYIAGKGKDFKQQYHIQLTTLSDQNPQKNAGTALCYMPKLSVEPLLTSKDHVIFVCAVLGELDANNPNNWFHFNKDDDNLTTNSMLQVIENKSDKETWDAMDNATFGILEEVLSPQGSTKVEYWHGIPQEGKWSPERPSEANRRIDGIVHESSTLHIGELDSAPVDLDYCLRGTTNVYVTGGALWPRGGSWNPTLTMVALAQHLADKLVG